MQLQQLQRGGALARPARRAVLSVRAVARPSSSAAPAPAAPAAAAAASPLPPLALAALAATGPLLLDAHAALATGGSFGLLEGRSAALVHPLVMGILFTLSGYAGFLGWQWRRTRTIGDDIKALKAQVPKAPQGEGAPAPPPSPLEGQIVALEKERKDLIAGGFKDKHTAAGSVLLAFGVCIAIEGCLNTWMRTGKLFPGPHLFAGAAIVGLWAAAAALVPAMQKGNDSARSAHIALNAVNLALFAWQVPTGLEIVGKVFEFTKWP
ncbi:hypothetical protein Rsub_04119 [Raphidocelis subcapitata]|uniref:DUF4079 domain-containing protein n=1 Tax=Raphidocelis subcapitata TaxID=307507 RepID=A0A2V0NVM2_9CHLO|nr:hypothetical protein Rsub_04119 [Raphidocelis subcapitata]|eukprot:GBF91379.1 hypothetical protein Rsub_04119 [Raphidocelis subcapitata]